MKNSIVSVDYLRRRLRYCDETGKLFWLHHKDMPLFWNTRYAGKEAFTSDNGKGYRQGAINGKLYFAHRVIWALKNGEWPEADIDHIDHNRSNNKIDNLRSVTRSDNSKNISLSSANKSGVNGVHWCSTRSKWRAEIGVNGLNKGLGYFSEKNDAIAARLKANAQHNFHINHGRKG